jgi:ATP-dependent DNA helicase PIF1
MPGELHTFYSVDQAVTDDVDEGREEFTREFLQSIELSGLPPSILQLKIGAPIMLLWNLRPSEGLCNGTRLVVKDFSQHVIHAQILTGNCKGNDCLIPHIQLYLLPDDLPFIISCRQFLVRLCFAMTVNKS